MSSAHRTSLSCPQSPRSPPWTKWAAVREKDYFLPRPPLAPVDCLGGFAEHFCQRTSCQNDLHFEYRTHQAHKGFRFMWRFCISAENHCMRLKIIFLKKNNRVSIAKSSVEKFKNWINKSQNSSLEYRSVVPKSPAPDGDRWRERERCCGVILEEPRSTHFFPDWGWDGRMGTAVSLWGRHPPFL